ncbi:PQQ-dependent sugar dehydrogenase [Mycolicibacterium austroafricanum]|uniref:PQQ-dependent sugar dehydrogenase n=1 Tax=Mycolicibacterium austroafricanum TaxID=39687 RepID=UPI001CA373A5|nr:PQQ-dependent sugar dehydrogenase [Mycolicibacterium austroafricanum]QZT63029.1 PQQ-dependent sugar dehydrogenase [Mycolicibacterium austroafricanum]
MRDLLRHKRFGVILLGATLLAGCSAEQQTAPPPAAPAPASSTSTAPAAGTARVTVEVDDSLAGAPFDEPREAVVPQGWTLSVWARTPRPRLAAWTPDGDLIVSVPSAGRVLRFTPRGDGPPVESVLLDGLDEPHGLAFDGSTLYVAESDQVDAYRYAAGAATEPRTVAGGLPDDRSPDLRGAYSHVLKSVAVGPDGAVYFSIGSTGNISAQDRTAVPPRATVMRVPPGGGPAEPFATGVRNGTGLAVAPDGAVWTANNGRDNIAYPEPGPSYGQVIPEYVDDNPPEQIARLTPGRELGWPYCNNVGGPADLPFVRDAQTNPDGALLDCAALPPVEQSMGAHSAPLGLSFVDGELPAPFHRGALVGVHGSWNRQPPRAPEVSFYPWQDGTLGNQQTLVGGFQADDGSRWGRPVAAVVGPDGAVYITDDAADAIYRLAPD